MNKLPSISLAVKALLQLGPKQLALYGLYQLGLHTGHYRRVLSASLARLDEINQHSQFSIKPCIHALPDHAAMLDLIGDQAKRIYEEADEIISGRVRLFGSQPVPLVLSPPGEHEYWTRYETDKTLTQDRDIKLIWEPGRFGWACKLAMAYHLTQDERYAQAFWQYTGLFLNSNLPYDGPHWSSAQEVAIRLVALAFAIQVFARSKYSTVGRLESLAQSITAHAERIPPTLAYARSQNNNHLITEALGLYTAAAVLPEHPLAKSWHDLGWKWLKHAFRTQISLEGEYIQHSTNYHRLMLQAALWTYALHHHSFSQEKIPPDIHSRLEKSTAWLASLVDSGAGRVPNLGHNDGAYILPLSVCPYYDYRPVIHAASRAFYPTMQVRTEPWADMAEWLCSPGGSGAEKPLPKRWVPMSPEANMTLPAPYKMTNERNGSWATLRVAAFRSRPAHADQLQFDLWWRGYNLAQDAGTYLYSSPPLWENSLCSDFVHNSLVVDNQEYMQRAGKFLYLDWAQGRVVSYKPTTSGDYESISARHNGYRKIGISYERKATILADGHWEITDQLDGPPGQPHTARLHWLLPDWQYEVLGPIIEADFTNFEIRISSPHGWVTLKTGISSQQEVPASTIRYQLVRAGIVVFGSGEASPIIGWTSPTYGEKIPALASIFEITQDFPITLRSEWIFPGES